MVNQLVIARPAFDLNLDDLLCDSIDLISNVGEVRWHWIPWLTVDTFHPFFLRPEFLKASVTLFSNEHLLAVDQVGEQSHFRLGLFLCSSLRSFLEVLGLRDVSLVKVHFSHPAVGKHLKLMVV